ncbi:hypothetical protein [Nocardioides alkalitolerans]|uniref:hypothetical protein n=1 Tax=Nocardioides alkalitolerans TaxID=281714 RepID=UPI00041DC969|nr:hypothetical protein [Nocardioides alkalitolerans]
MDLKDLARSALRRWYVLLVCLLLTAAGALGIARSMPASYDVSSSILLLPPASSVGDEGNPYLYLSGLGQAVDVLVTRLTSDAVAQPVLERHPGVTLTVERDVSTTGPIILVSASGPDAADGESTVAEVVAALPGQLADLQSALDVPDGSVITSTVLTAPEDAAPNTKARTRAATAVVGAGLVLSVLVTALADRVLLDRRRRRTGEAADPVAVPEPVTVPEPVAAAEPVVPTPTPVPRSGRKSGPTTAPRGPRSAAVKRTTPPERRAPSTAADPHQEGEHELSGRR